ncbi:hypothetical protein Xen7305DRAFT_00003590 [Xenococcus sp. PCC 7305]|uniref:hypothetical protein n=1 Tax=Xenococcus sp. PCC 7305 TaxID=102125 RepID=UPI0002ACB8A4|nr:hypothetical protein [Xenococcus sp. PCC 7305]ELS00658.1 hypothetical protein Xen7305DRAFT_00003590 [Xenococcus sp. PCC 7305]
MSNVKGNNLELLGRILLMIPLLVGAVNGVKANSPQKSLVEPLSLSQSLGHQEYKGESQGESQIDDYEAEKIVSHYGVTISVFPVSSEDETIVRASSSVDSIGSIGDNVLVFEEDGKRVIVGSAPPAWVGTLIKDYGLNIEDYRK